MKAPRLAFRLIFVVLLFGKVESFLIFTVIANIATKQNLSFFSKRLYLLCIALSLIGYYEK